MRLPRIAILLILVGALLLNGCDTSPLSQQPATEVSPAEPAESAATDTPIPLSTEVITATAAP